MTAPVVVGVDIVDTSHGKALLDFAANEARLRGTSLWLAHAYQWVPPVAFALGADAATEDAMREAAVALLAEAAAHIRIEHPDLHLETVPAGGSAPEVLTDICATPALIVVGGRGRGGFAGQMLGSVALRVVSLARCPVMVVRGDTYGVAHEVVVGLDVENPACGPELFDFAFEEADLRHVRLRTVHACDWQQCLEGKDSTAISADHLHIESDRRRRVEAAVEPWKGKYPGVAAAEDVCPGSAAKVLVSATRGAGLIVIGGRIRNKGHSGMRIGALGHTILHHAHCPVVIVPETSV